MEIYKPVTFANPAQPHSWWTVDAVRFGGTGGLTLYYRLGERQPIRRQDGKWIRDGRGRTALEAFGALPIEEMYRRLGEGAAAWRALDDAARSSIEEVDPEREPRRWRDAFRELVDFVATFGPLGFAWSRTFDVENRDADRALDELRRLQFDALRGATGAGPTIDPATGLSPSAWGEAREWQMVMKGPGFGLPSIYQIHSEPRLPWAERVRIGDQRLWQDFLGPGTAGPLWGAQDDLRRAIGLVNALSPDQPNPFAVRDAFGALPRSLPFHTRDRGDRDPIDVDWREAMRGSRRARDRWDPFREDPRTVDLVAAGRRGLAEFLTEQLAMTTIGVGLDAQEQFRTRWTVGSLLEVIYLQLVEQVEQRLEFGIGHCPVCQGPILGTRLSERTRNRAHSGCGSVIRKRRQRERQKLASADR